MEEETKKKGGAKKLLIILGVILVMVVVAYFILVKYEQNQAEKTIENIFVGLQNGVENNEYLTEMLNESNDDSTKTGENNTYNEICKKLNYKILSTEGNLKNATIVVEVSNKNIKTILSNYMTKAFQLAFVSAFSPDKLSEEEMNEQLENYLQEQIESEEIETLTNTVTLNLQKNNGKWVLNDESKTEMINAILPGLSEWQQAIENSGNEIKEGE